MSAPRRSETDLIDRYVRPLATDRRAFSLRDDAAWLGPWPDHPPTDAPPWSSGYVATMDTLVADVHFFPDDPAGDIARKALRVNLSDLAASGAAPDSYLLALAAPTGLPDLWYAKFFDALADDQRRFSLSLLGGDTVRTPGPLTISVAAFGSTGEQGMCTRSGARPGDHVFVTGPLGDAALGLRVRARERGSSLRPGSAGDQIDRGLAACDAVDIDQFRSRYLRPQPRLDLNPALARWAHAAMDISDGLILDANRLCTASGARLTVDVMAVPMTPAARRVVGDDADLRAAVLSGGDDYELLVCVPPPGSDDFRAAIASGGGRLIGVLHDQASEPPGAQLHAAGTTLTAEEAGYQHRL